MEDRATKYASWLVENQDKKGSPEFETVANAYRQMRQGGGASEPVAPAEEAAVAEGDWSGLKTRLDERTKGMKPEDAEKFRLQEAKRQGALYGKTRGAGETFERDTFNTLTLGAGRLAESYLPKWLGGQSELPGAEAHEFIKGADEARGSSNPIASTAGTVAGIGGQIATLPASIGGQTIARGAQALGMGAKTAAAAGRVVSGAGLGAGLGATEKAIESRGDLGEAATGAAWGAGGGLAGGLVGEAVGSALANRAARKTAEKIAPSADDLAKVASQKYKEAKDAGVWFAPQAYRGFVDDVKRTLTEAGVDEGLHTKVMSVVTRLEKEAGDAVTLDKMDLLRRVAGSAAKSKEPDEGRLASILIDKLDEFVDGAGPQSVIFGDADKGVKALQEARAAYAAKSRSERIGSVVDTGRLNADVAGSGSNVDNTIRQAARSIIKSKNGTRGFSEEEIAALRDVASGGPIRNALRALGKFAPTGVVSGSLSAGTGFGVAGPIGAAALPAVGYASKALADRGTRRAAEQAAALARLRVVPGAAQKIEAARNNPNYKKLQQMLALMATQVGVAASPDGIQ